MSTSKTEWTWAEVRRDSTMCSAIFFRIADIACRSTRAPGENAIAGSRGGGAPGGGGGRRGGRGGLGHEVEDVLLRPPAPRAGPRNARRIDPMLVGDLAHDGGDE